MVSSNVVRDIAMVLEGKGKLVPEMALLQPDQKAELKSALAFIVQSCFNAGVPLEEVIRVLRDFK